MKKNVVLLAILLFYTCAYSQTETVVGKQLSGSMNWSFVTLKGSNNLYFGQFFPNDFDVAGQNVFYPNGNIGLSGNLFLLPGSFLGIESNESFSYGGYSLSHYGFTWLNDANRTLAISSKNGMKLFSGGKVNMVVNTLGNVGIGTENPSNKLDVNGTIRAKEVKVESGWADFVFKPNYQLRPLAEVEQFINTNGHLPEIPTEKEVAQHGVSVGEMNAKLLQKIEELTLYLIEQNKKIDILSKENKNLKQMINGVRLPKISK